MYTAEVRNGVWKDINIGKFFSNIRATDEILADIVFSDRCGSRPGEMHKSGREFLNQKAFETLNKDVTYLIIYREPQLDGW